VNWYGVTGKQGKEEIEEIAQGGDEEEEQVGVAHY
jgi:hypothetical protein